MKAPLPRWPELGPPLTRTWVRRAGGKITLIGTGLRHRSWEECQPVTLRVESTGVWRRIVPDLVLC